jgi:hypothetical protein
MSVDPTSAPPAEAASSPPAAIEQASDASAALAQIPAEQSAPVAADSPPLAPAEEPAAALATSKIIGDACDEVNGQKPRGRPFEPGQSGNPLGRPKGSRNRVTQVAEALIHGQAEALVAKAVEKALAGDTPMLRALLTTLVPHRPHRTVEFELPKVETAADAVAASSAVLAACSRGEISLAEASEVMALIATHVHTIEVAHLEERMAALEEKQSPLKMVDTEANGEGVINLR